MTDSDAMVQLLGGLIQATSEGRIKWEPAKGRSDAFEYVGRASRVLIGSRDDDSAYPYQLTILDNANRVVESLQTSWSNDPFGDPEPEPWNADIDELYQLARRSALNIDVAIRDLLRDAEQGYQAPDYGEFGEEPF